MPNSLEEACAAYRLAEQQLTEAKAGDLHTIERYKAVWIACKTKMDQIIEQAYHELTARYTHWFPAKEDLTPEEQQRYRQECESWCDRYLQKMADGWDLDMVALAQVPFGKVPTLRAAVQSLQVTLDFPVNPSLLGSLVAAVAREQANMEEEIR